MDLYGCHFEYAGELSRKYGLMIANVNTDRNTMISGKVESLSVFNKRNQSRNDLGSNYSEAPLSFDMEIVSESIIRGELRRKIQKWLFNQHGYKKLYIDRADEACDEVFGLDNGAPRRTYLNCRFINPEKIEGNGGIVGYKFTVECDSHMAWQDPLRKKFSFDTSEEEYVIELDVDTDIADYTYPKVTIYTGTTGGDISIVNLSDGSDRTTSFLQLPASTQIVINGVYNYISDNFYEHFENRNFPRLLDGKNKLLIRGDVSAIEFEWQNKRYL